MKVEPLEVYRLNELDTSATIVGQGPPPESYKHFRDGELVCEIHFGNSVEASSQTTNLKDYSPGKVKIKAILQELADAGMLTHLPKQT